MTIPTCVVAEDAGARLAACLSELPTRDASTHSGLANTLLVTDETTREVAGLQLAGELEASGITTRTVVLEPDVRPDDRAVSRVSEALPGVASIVAVGAGAITDVVRYATYLVDRDFISFPTAASMDGYASGMAVLERDGAKVTLAAAPPTAIFCDPRIVATAPLELTRAGIGDLLAKVTARVDWLASHLLCGERFDPAVARRVLSSVDAVTVDFDGLLSGSVTASGELMDGLTQSGIAMAMYGDSRPCSGSEHQVSHLLDLAATRRCTPHTRHGLQVGYLTRFAMALQRFAFGGGVEQLRVPMPVAVPFDSVMRLWFGPPTDEMVRAFRQKQDAISAQSSQWPSDQSAWRAVQDRLAPELDRFAAIDEAISRAGITARAPHELISAAFRYANRMRARYTVLDFLEGQGVLDDAIAVALAPSDVTAVSRAT